jgi:hypothetical protein
MSNIINGYSSPRFRILYKTGAFKEDIDLPLTNESGLIESCDIKQLVHEFIDFSAKQTIYGYRIHFTLHYDRFVQEETLLKIEKILSYAKGPFKLIIIPRIDHPWRWFEVYVSMDNFDLGILRGGAKAIGHRLPVLVFTTVNLEQELKWYAGDYNPIETLFDSAIL